MDVTDIEDQKPDSYRVTADELRQFIERFERLEQEKKVALTASHPKVQTCSS